MNEEEKKAIELVKEFKKNGFHLLNLKYESRVSTNRHIENSIETLLNLIEKQQKEIECLNKAGKNTEKVYKLELDKKDNKIANQNKEIKLLKEFHNKNVKIIDLMVEEINFMNNIGEWIDRNNIDKLDNKEEVKEYFTKKVEKEEMEELNNIKETTEKFIEEAEIFVRERRKNNERNKI